MKAIVFVLRGCPAGWLGAYGNEWVVTPNLDRLAAESVVFDRHISDCPDPAAASAAWLGVGRPNPPTPFPRREGGVGECPFPRGGGVGEGLLASLRTRGIPTVLVRANHPDTDGPDWFYAGWDEVFDARPQEEDESPLDALLRELPRVLDRLTSTPESLLWIEIDRLLPPWEVSQRVFEAYLLDGSEDPEPESEETQSDDEPDDAEEDDDGDDEDDEEADPGTDDSEPSPEDAEATRERIPPWNDPPEGPFDGSDPDAFTWLHASFAAVVTSLDVELGRVFEELRSRGLDDSAAWLLTSDFGYPLGEHGQIGPHRPWLHEELVHLPLFLRLPGAVEACRRVFGFTQPSDVAATLCELFGAEMTGGFSLLPSARGEAESRREHAVTELEINGASELAIRTADWAFLRPVRVPDGEVREPMLFAKPDDRWEVNDMHGRNVERAEELEAKLRRNSPTD